MIFKKKKRNGMCPSWHSNRAGFHLTAAEKYFFFYLREGGIRFSRGGVDGVCHYKVELTLMPKNLKGERKRNFIFKKPRCVFISFFF